LKIRIFFVSIFAEKSNMFRAEKYNKQLTKETGIKADEQKEASRAADSRRRSAPILRDYDNRIRQPYHRPSDQWLKLKQRGRENIKVRHSR
jgi:hypothetical protein